MLKLLDDSCLSVHIFPVQEKLDDSLDTNKDTYETSKVRQRKQIVLLIVNYLDLVVKLDSQRHCVRISNRQLVGGNMPPNVVILLVAL